MVQPNDTVAILVIFLVFFLPSICAILLYRLVGTTRRSMSISYSSSASHEIVDDGDGGSMEFQRHDQPGGIRDEDSPPGSQR